MVHYGQFRMLSVKDMAAVKVAVEICNTPELKREILCDALGDDDCDSRHLREQWKEKVEKKASIILSNLNLPMNLPEEVMSNVPLVGTSMLNWAVYHEGILGFSREYSIYILKSSFFTQQGNIDNKKAAEGLMNDINLSIVQKYMLACIYCFTNRILILYRKMTKKDKQMFYNARPQSCIKKYRLVVFWSYLLVGEVDKLKGEKTVRQYRLEKAVESGCKAAVEYCLKGLNSTRDNDAVVDAAEEAVKNRITSKSDWIVFCHQRSSIESWVPSDYYIEILCFLMSKMGELQRIEFLKKDIEGAKYEEDIFDDQRHSRVLDYFLGWPYQDFFMKTAELMWEFLPERNYSILLLKVCDKIEFEQDDKSKHFEKKNYDYRGLLKGFWDQSPERYKRYVFSNQYVVYETSYIKYSGRVGHELLFKLLRLTHFSLQDKENIRLILARATVEEKEKMARSMEWKCFCLDYLRQEKWEKLERFVINCFSNTEEAKEFKTELIIKFGALSICIDFVKNDKWDAAESFIKWCSLSEEEIKQYKRDMIYTEYGMRACMDLVSKYEDLEVVNKICKWCFASEEQARKFKVDLLYSVCGLRCMFLVLKGKIGLVDEIICWCLSFKKEKIKKFRKHLALRMGNYFCEILISDIAKDIKNTDGTRIFKGGKWEEVEKFMTLCFTSEREINDFKSNLLFAGLGVTIHFKLIQYNQWEEAETFFSWLNLTFEQVKCLKKETLLDYSEGKEMFFRLMVSKEGDREFVDYGSKQEAIELLLRWYLTDEKTVLEFNKEFKHEYGYHLSKEGVLKDFDFAIIQRLSDLRKEQMGVMWKSGTFSRKKKFCNIIRS